MADQHFASLLDPIRSFSFDSAAILTNSTINALHFPGLANSVISDSGNASIISDNRRASILLDGIGMCDSMTESFCSTMGQDDMIMNTTSPIDALNGSKIDRKDSTVQKKRRSRKSQFDASIDSPSLDRIEPVNLVDDQTEADDVW
jgi:hypothetical protein